ncbi:hypothetical protein KQX54_013663 [Cotesia glomerata]|uniref:Uncharacterized protein n=1 Tax=Cotesia glomerata TaxID=32391 RepID=A0AAV7IHL5_COTGL|nr:hypothetical protein KQX54_013663 [Cotesia glomerata]
MTRNKTDEIQAIRFFYKMKKEEPKDEDPNKIETVADIHEPIDEQKGDESPEKLENTREIDETQKKSNWKPRERTSKMTQTSKQTESTQGAEAEKTGVIDVRDLDTGNNSVLEKKRACGITTSARK